MEIVRDWSVYRNFKESEFACKCDCGIVRVSKELVDKLQRARDMVRMPFVILSGCRCPSHNSNFSKNPNSDHVTDEGDKICCAADIRVSNDRERFLIERALYSVGFDRIGHHEGFIHAGVSVRNTGMVSWLYW